jgi:two-component system, sensor histidine kinase and response regulator
MNATHPAATDSDTVVLHCAVCDTGIGIPAAKQALIFEAFTQVDGSLSRKYGGPGLGLTSAAKLVECMGGRIWDESAEGQGSVFHVTMHLGLQAAPKELGRSASPEAVDTLSSPAPPYSQV